MSFVRKMTLALALAGAAACHGQTLRSQAAPSETNWKKLSLSLAAYGAASGFDAWTSWQRPERNGFLSSGGRFTAESAYKKAGVFGAVAIAEVLVVKLWGRKHPWLERACRIGNLTSAGVLAGAGARNLSYR